MTLRIIVKKIIPWKSAHDVKAISRNENVRQIVGWRQRHMPGLFDDHELDQKPC
jgi:hypothetical protein